MLSQIIEVPDFKSAWKLLSKSEKNFSAIKCPTSVSFSPDSNFFYDFKFSKVADIVSNFKFENVNSCELLVDGKSFEKFPNEIALCLSKCNSITLRIHYEPSCPFKIEFDTFILCTNGNPLPIHYETETNLYRSGNIYQK